MQERGLMPAHCHRPRGRHHRRPLDRNPPGTSDGTQGRRALHPGLASRRARSTACGARASRRLCPRANVHAVSGARPRPLALSVAASRHHTPGRARFPLGAAPVVSGHGVWARADARVPGESGRLRLGLRPRPTPLRKQPS
jgi:hypothetical protein